MRHIIVLIVSLVALFSSCRKKCSDLPGTCTQATITQQAATCEGWGIVVNGIIYPSLNIPPAFRQEGTAVCARYTLFEDLRKCACCGGLYAVIISMQ